MDLGVIKLRKGKVITLPYLGNTNIENVFNTSNVAYKDKKEHFPKYNEYDDYCLIFNRLSNIISNIHGESQLIELYSKDSILDKAYLTKGVNSIKKNCLRLTKTISNIFELERFENKLVCLNLNNANIVEIIDNIVINASEYIKNTVIFDTDIEEKLVQCDINKLQKAVLILLSVAAKHSKEKEILVNLRTYEDSINIDVSFNNRNNKSYNYFLDKMDNLTFENLDELSLDLYLCKLLIALHEGRIFVDGDECKTNFTIELPCANADAVYYLFHNKADYELLDKQIQIEFSDLY